MYDMICGQQSIIVWDGESSTLGKYTVVPHTPQPYPANWLSNCFLGNLRSLMISVLFVCFLGRFAWELRVFLSFFPFFKICTAGCLFLARGSCFLSYLFISISIGENISACYVHWYETTYSTSIEPRALLSLILPFPEIAQVSAWDRAQADSWTGTGTEQNRTSQVLIFFKRSVELCLQREATCWERKRSSDYWISVDVDVDVDPSIHPYIRHIPT